MIGRLHRFLLGWCIFRGCVYVSCMEGMRGRFQICSGFLRIFCFYSDFFLNMSGSNSPTIGDHDPIKGLQLFVIYLLHPRFSHVYILSLSGCQHVPSISTSFPFVQNLTFHTDWFIEIRTLGQLVTIPI